MDKLKQNKMFYIGLAALVLAGILLVVVLVLFNNKSHESTKKPADTAVTSTATTTEPETGSETTTTSTTTEQTRTEQSTETTNTQTVQPATMTMKVFFGSTAQDPEALHCDKVYAVNRTVEQTVAVGRVSLGELLKGVTQAEKDQGYFSSMPAGVELKSLEVKNGVAYANFNDKLVASGSCSSERIRAQIEQTLKQWPTVKSVVIQVNGKSDDVLQP